MAPQEAQELAASSAEKEPPAQSLHSSDPADGLNLPAVQATHDSCEPSNPGSHSHSLLPGTECDLEGHSAQLTAAGPSENLPASHGAHSPDPLPLWYVPAAHAEQTRTCLTWHPPVGASAPPSGGSPDPERSSRSVACRALVLQLQLHVMHKRLYSATVQYVAVSW